MAEIVLYMSDARLEALEQAMEKNGCDCVTGYMQDRLIDLFTEMVPVDQQIRIQNAMDAERSQISQEPPAVLKPAPPEAPLREKARPLQPEDCIFEGDVLRYGNHLNFKFEPCPSVCEALGVPDDIWQPGALGNLYVNFNLETGKPDDSLSADLMTDDQCSDIMEVRFSLSAEEQAMLLPIMDAYCQKNRGKSLSDCTRLFSRQAVREAEETPPEKRQGKKPPAR